MLHTHLYLIITLTGRKTEGYELSDKAKFFRVPGTYTLFISVPMVMQDWEVRGELAFEHSVCFNKLVYALCQHKTAELFSHRHCSLLVSVLYNACHA
jgi:hypothetical protein